MILRAPVGCRSISFGGSILLVGDDGCVDVDSSAAGQLMAHGFVRIEGESLSGAANMAIDISTLSRRALFRLLKEHNASVSLPITNEALRARARQALASQKGGMSGVDL